MDLETPVIALLLPSVYILAAVIGLLQFQVVFTLLLQGAAKVRTIDALKFAKPVVQNLADFLVKIFGQPQKFVPQTTHVLLVALMMAIIIHLERLRKATLAKQH